MPTIRLTTDTMRLIRDQALPGFDFLSTARRRPNGNGDVPVGDEVAYTVATARLPGESDDDVVSRLAQAAVGKKPDQLGQSGRGQLRPRRAWHGQWQSGDQRQRCHPEVH